MSDASSPALPTYRLDDTVAVITMDDGKANVMSTAVVDTLHLLLDRAESDGARALVLTGRSRDGATGAVAGVVLGYAGVILLALFRGVL